MKRIIAAAFAALFAMPAAAADIGMKDYPVQREAAEDFTKTPFAGLSIGAEIGGQFNAWDLATSETGCEGECSASAHADGISSDGWLFGLQAEYLFQAGRLRFGPEIRGGFGDVNSTVNFTVREGEDSAGFGADLELEHYYGAYLKAGVIVGKSSLLFAHVGYEWQAWTASCHVTGGSCGSVDVDTEWFVIGGGIGTMLADNISATVTADYLALSDISADGVGSSVNSQLSDVLGDSEAVRVLGRVGYQF